MLQTWTKAANKLIWAKLIYLRISYLPFSSVAIPLLQADCHFNGVFHDIFIKWLHMFPRQAASRAWYKKAIWKEYDSGENLSVLYIGVGDEWMQRILLLNKVCQSIVWKIKHSKCSLLLAPSIRLPRNVPMRKDGEVKSPWASANAPSFPHFATDYTEKWLYSFMSQVPRFSSFFISMKTPFRHPLAKRQPKLSGEEQEVVALWSQKASKSPLPCRDNQDIFTPDQPFGACSRCEESNGFWYQFLTRSRRH